METDKKSDEIIPVEVFSGTLQEVALVESLLENAEIRVYIYYGGEGAFGPWDSGGNLPLSRIIVSSEDFEKAMIVVDQYRESLDNLSAEDIPSNDL